MEAKASASMVRIGPRKVRLVADLIRGKKAKEAERLLQVTVKKGADELRKVLHAAIANAENRGDVDTDNLVVKTVYVNGGPVLKRWLARARGMATPLKKRTSHITLVLEER